MKTRKLSIRTKMLLASVLIVLVVGLVLGITSYVQLRTTLISMGVEQARVAANVALKVIDTDMVGTLEPGDEDTESYQQLKEALLSVKDDCHVKFLYTLTTDGSTVYYDVDADATDECMDIGDEFEVEYEELADVFAGQEYLQDYIDSTEEDGDLITAYLPIQTDHGTFVLGCDYDASDIVSDLRGAGIRLILIAAIAVIVAFVLICLIVSSITGSLRKVNNKLYELANREGDLTQKIEVKSGDETELIADNVNDLLKFIREIMVRVMQNAGQLKHSSHSITDRITEANDNIAGVSSTMEQMSAAMEQTSASLGQINGEVSHIYDSSSAMLTEANHSSSSAQEISARANTLRNDAVEKQQTAKELGDEIGQVVSEKIERSKSVAQINALTDNILEITSQTNLLALNASIEAARAGEAGKGFAVVADEIGTLAGDSAQAAEKIRKVSSDVIEAVEELAKEAEKMVEFMEKTAMEGYELLLSACEDYSKDAQDISDIAKQFTDNSSAMKESVETIRETMQAVATAVEESAQGVSDTTAMSMQITEGMNQILTEARENREIANLLDSEVNKFKLE